MSSWGSPYRAGPARVYRMQVGRVRRWLRHFFKGWTPDA